MPRTLLVAREALGVLNRMDRESGTTSRDINSTELHSQGEVTGDDEEEEVDVDVVSEPDDKPLDFSLAAPTQSSILAGGTSQTMLYGEYSNVDIIITNILHDEV